MSVLSLKLDELKPLATDNNISLEDIINIIDHHTSELLDKNYLEKVPIDIFLEIIKDLKYDDIIKLCQGNRELNRICNTDKVKTIIERKRKSAIELPPRRTHQSFTPEDLKVGAIYNKVLLTEFTRDHKSLLIKYIKEFIPCGCGESYCTKYVEYDIVGIEDLSDLEPYAKYHFIRGSKYNNYLNIQPYVITRVQDNRLFARKVEKVNGRWRYLNEPEEILIPYPLKQSSAFRNSAKIGYLFEDGNIAIIPNSFKIK